MKTMVARMNEDIELERKKVREGKEENGKHEREGNLYKNEDTI